MHVPAGLDAPPSSFCCLCRSLYGLKKALKAWFNKFWTTVIKSGIKQIHYDNSLPSPHNNTYRNPLGIHGWYSYHWWWLLWHKEAAVYFNHVFTWMTLVPWLIFSDLKLIVLTVESFWLRPKYAKELINLAHLTDFKPVDTPIETNVKFHKDFGDPISNPTLYQKLVGSLIYLTTWYFLCCK